MRRTCHFQTFLCLVVLVTCLPGIAAAQEVVDLDPFIDDVESLDEIDQSSPLKTAQGFMRFAELGDYESAAQYLDLRYLPEELDTPDGALLAEQLYVVISRELRIEFGDLSDEPAGAEGDGLPSYRDELGKIETVRGERTVYLQQIPGPNGSNIWKISNSSVARIPDLYSEFGYSPLVEVIRAFSPDGSFLGAELFKWIMAVLAGLAGALAWLVLAWPLSKILTRRNVGHTERVKRYLTRPIPAMIFILLGGSVIRELGLGVTAQRVAQSGTMITIVIVWLLFATINLLRDLYAQYLQSRGRESGLMLLRPVTSTAKVVVGALATVIWLDNAGINVTALIAGLGVGGIAVALVLQKPLEDILGAVTLYTQQPVTVGQLCTSGNVTGTIEEINLRTTRVRKVNNNIVVIPNSVFATASIENISERSRILHRQIVRLALETSESTARSVLQGLREMLMGMDKVSDDSTRVRLIGFGEFSIDVEVFAHIGTKDWDEFLAIAEDINLGTVSVMEKVGAKFAEPPR